MEGVLGPPQTDDGQGTRVLEHIKHDFLVKFHAGFLNAFDDLTEILIVLLLKRPIDDYIVQIEQDSWTVFPDVRHDLLESRCRRRQPETNSFKIEKALHG